MAWPAPDSGMPPSPPALPEEPASSRSRPQLSDKPASLLTSSFILPSTTSTVTGVLLEGVPVQEPCLSQSQSMTLEAHAFSQGVDVTSSVGPFTWSHPAIPASPRSSRLPNNAYNFATNQANATATFPGITQIFASASGVTSKSFQQPQYSNPQGNFTRSRLLCDLPRPEHRTRSWERRCPGQTSFAPQREHREKRLATVTDIMGNSSLPNTNGGSSSAKSL